MQTFLPLPDFAESARVLDTRRLGKQRVETLQIVKALVLKTGGWQRHPAVRMWAGHVPGLVAYQRAVCFEWTCGRGFKDTCLDKTAVVAGTLGDDTDKPDWFGDPAFHLAHRSNLLRKDPEHYGKLWPGVPDDLPYIWPPTPA